MQITVYKSEKHEGHFVYLPSADIADSTDYVSVLEALPAPVQKRIGEISLVVEFELTQNRQLPNADAATIAQDIENQGFYLQLPRKDMYSQEEQYFGSRLN